MTSTDTPSVQHTPRPCRPGCDLPAWFQCNTMNDDAMYLCEAGHCTYVTPASTR